MPMKIQNSTKMTFTTLNDPFSSFHMPIDIFIQEFIPILIRNEF